MRRPYILLRTRWRCNNNLFIHHTRKLLKLKWVVFGFCFGGQKKCHLEFNLQFYKDRIIPIFHVKILVKNKVEIKFMTSYRKKFEMICTKASELLYTFLIKLSRYSAFWLVKLRFIGNKKLRKRSFIENGKKFNI